jgi:hypothetical protein
MTTLAFAAVEQALARTAGENINNSITPKHLLEQSLINSLIPKGDAEVELEHDYGHWSYIVPGKASEEDRTIIFDLQIFDDVRSEPVLLNNVLKTNSPYSASCQWVLKCAVSHGREGQYGESVETVSKEFKLVDGHNQMHVITAAAKAAIHEAYSDAEHALKVMLSKPYRTRTRQ